MPREVIEVHDGETVQVIPAKITAMLRVGNSNLKICFYTKHSLFGCSPFATGYAGMGRFLPNSQKGGQGDLQLASGVTGNQIPLTPPFAKGEAKAKHAAFCGALCILENAVETLKPFDTPAKRATQGERWLTKLERSPFVLSALRSKVYRSMNGLQLPNLGS